MAERQDGFWAIHQAKMGDIKKEPNNDHNDQTRPYKIFGCNSHLFSLPEPLD